MAHASLAMMALTDIRPDPQQPRRFFDPTSIKELAESLRQVGLQQPIRVRPDGDGFVLVDGERRYRAAQSLGWKTIQAVVEERPLDAAGALQRQLICNCQREDLTPLEKAAAIERLMRETNWTESQVASKLGFSCATVTRLLSLLQLPEALREKIAQGRIGASAGYELARINDPAQQAELAEQLIAGELTRDGLAGRAKAARRARSAAEPVLARGRIQLGDGRSVTVAGPQLSTESLIDWLEELLAKARKARAQGLELGTLVKMLNDQAKARRNVAG